ncbi:hypothetical protein [Microvirga sp. G4-2]|uniref:hypothetical protein n=1 Tax=Microvirga sp. G4-2 TaxID=3434467 RepID=UPI004043E48C
MADIRQNASNGDGVLVLEGFSLQPLATGLNFPTAITFSEDQNQAWVSESGALPVHRGAGGRAGLWSRAAGLSGRMFEGSWPAGFRMGQRRPRTPRAEARTWQTISAAME